MQIEYVDAKLETTRLSKLSTGDTFLSPKDKKGEVCMFLERDPSRFDNYQYVVFGEVTKVVWDNDHNVRRVKCKLVVEI